jgi:hypothetical protein
MLDTNVVMLVDTGSSETILKKDLYENLPSNKRPELRPVNISLTMATGDTFPFHGKATVTFITFFKRSTRCPYSRYKE